jgi:hypothetical protein
MTAIAKREHWIPVLTSDGMFSTERAVSLKLADGTEVSFFVDVSQIREETTGIEELKVVLVDNDTTSHRQRVLLPTETFETATRWVEVAA